MIVQLFGFLLGITFGFLTHGQEFMYPVGSIQYDGSEKVFLVYQKSLEHLELLMWDPVTKIATKGLLSTYTPAALKVMPQQSGFSFIDKGSIKVKLFGRRSPKSVSFYEPIDQITLLEWSDPSTFYFMARGAQRFGIYQGTVRGDVAPILVDDAYDYSFPQRIGDTLFVIRRSEQGQYQIISVPYAPKESDVDRLLKDAPSVEAIKKHSGDEAKANNSCFENAQEKQPEQNSECDKETNVPKKSVAHGLQGLEPLEGLEGLIESGVTSVADLGQSTASFLSMVNDSLGFYVEHPETIDRSSVTTSFTYWMIQRNEQGEMIQRNEQGGWKRSYLFTFALPTYLLVDPTQRLYESLLPLLPRRIDTGIYFVHCYDKEQVGTGVFKFDLKKETFDYVGLQDNAVPLVSRLYFAPFVFGTKIFLGGSVDTVSDDSRSLNAVLSDPAKTLIQSPMWWLDDQGLMRVELPCVDCVKN